MIFRLEIPHAAWRKELVDQCPNAGVVGWYVVGKNWNGGVVAVVQHLQDFGGKWLDGCDRIRGRKGLVVAENRLYVLMTGDDPVVDICIVEYRCLDSGSGQKRKRVGQVERVESGAGV